MSHRSRFPNRSAPSCDFHEGGGRLASSRARMAAVWLACCALTAGAASGARAADSHGHEAAPSTDATSAAEPSIRPRLKPDLKAEARGDGKAVRGEVKTEAKAEPKAEAKPEAKAEPKTEAKADPKAEPKVEPKGEHKEPKADTKADAKPAAKSEPRGAMSMSELRDVLDQKISEVRARQASAPVVQLRSRGGKGAASSRAAAAAAADAGASASAKPRGDWSYSGDTGPEHWASLKPEFSQCGKGQRQSPIDIRDGIPVELDPIAFDYRPSAFRVIDTGHTVQVNLASGNRVTVNGRRYELTQFHFHRPSEERLNGKQFDMSVHLEHRDIEGKLAVIAILINEGKGHPLVQQVWNNLPLEKFTEQAGLATIDLSQILPEQRQYVTYMGSQTTPPCQEGVLWMVMKQPVMASPEQMAIFARLYPMNARPVQPSAGRLIKDGQ